MKNLMGIILTLLLSAASVLSQAPVPLKSPSPFGRTLAPTWAGGRGFARTIQGTAFASNDVPMAVASDSSGNVYVTGMSRGSSGNDDWVTLKYNSSGAQVWLADFNGWGNSFDEPTAIAVDPSGNVYVTGYTASTSTDFLTVKYDSSGNIRWFAQYDGPGHSQDIPSAISIDETGNVYVTGNSVGASSTGFATIKYNADGVEEWVARFEGDASSINYPWAVAHDGGGNVYVAGYAGGRSATIKYNSSGITQWIATHDSAGAYALALDAAGNVYVTGAVAGAVADFLTVKYNASGVQQWESRYDGPGHNTDEAHAIAVDAGGNVYITGPSCGVGLNFNSATIKYDASGTEQWVRRYSGGGGFGDYSFQLALDGAGHVNIAGYSDAWGAGYDFTVIQYDAAGTEQWLNHYGGPANETDYLNAMAVDNAGNVYVTGNSAGIGTSNDYATVKYSTGGVEQWSARYDGGGSQTTNHWITVTEDPNGTVSPSKFVYVLDGAEQDFIIHPSADYHIDSVIVDGVFAGTDTTYAFSNITSDHTLRAHFALNADAFQYRTFTYDSLVVKKPIKKKVVTEYWEFTIANSTTATIRDVHIRFATDALTILSAGGLTPSGSGKDWLLSGTMARDEVVVVAGRSPKPRPQAIDKLWLGPITDQPRTNILPTREYPELPLPNAANLRDDAFSRGVFSSTNGLLVGIPENVPRPTHGWVRMPTSAKLFSSLTERGLRHDAVVTGFSAFANLRPIRGELRSLPPVKQNDRVFADLAALKFSIALSAAGITPVGLGELRYVEAGSPYDGKLVREIVGHADTLMTFYVTDLGVYEKMDSVLERINLAFSGQLDTVAWANALQLQGVRRLREVSFLQASGVPPATIPLLPEGAAADVPSTMALEQNYPNPFNPTTTIRIQLSAPSRVSLRVYNLVGQEVAALANGQMLDAGEQEFAFNASTLASGIYFYRMVAETMNDDGTPVGERFVSVRKMLLLK